MIGCFQKMITLSLSLQGLLFFAQYKTITVSSYCTGYLRNRDIAGIWRLTSKQSFLPKLSTATKKSNSNHLPNVKKSYPLKEFTVYPKDKQSFTIDTTSSTTSSKSGNDDGDGNQEEDILLLLREDGTFVQYASSERGRSDDNKPRDPLFANYEMKGSWALVDGKLILAAERPKNVNNIRSEGHHRDTILEGRIVAVSDTSLVDNPALSNQQKVGHQQQDKDNENSGSVHLTSGSGNSEKTEDVHLSVPKGKVKVGKFFYPLNHPSFFEQPIFSPTSTGSFELRQVLGTLNTHLQHEDKLVEKFRKKDLMDKRYFITSYPLPTAQRKRKRWSIKYNKYVGKSVMNERQSFLSHCFTFISG